MRSTGHQSGAISVSRGQLMRARSSNNASQQLSDLTLDWVSQFQPRLSASIAVFTVSLASKWSLQPNQISVVPSWSILQLGLVFPSWRWSFVCFCTLLASIHDFPDWRLAEYIVQGHRFNIFEDIGCSPASYYTWPIYPIQLLPPIFVGLFSATYAVLTIRAFYKNNAQFNAVLSKNGNITSHRFIRLMCLAGVEILFNIPLALYGISIQARAPLNPYISWENVHYNFSRVPEVPAIIWKNNPTLNLDLELTRWSIIFCAFVFFIFFGFADEAKKNYRYAFQSVAKRVGLSTGTSSFGHGVDSSFGYGSDECVPHLILSKRSLSDYPIFFSKITRMKSKSIGKSGKVRPILPVFVQKEMLHRRDSVDSFNMTIGDVSNALANDQLSPTDSEKKLDYYPDLSYGALSGSASTRVNDSERLASFPSSSAASLNSSASSVTYPSPARARQDSAIEISSVHRDSTYISPPAASNSPSESSQPQRTNHSAV